MNDADKIVEAINGLKRELTAVGVMLAIVILIAGC